MKGQIVRGGLWLLAEVAGGEIIGMAAFVVLSRLLTPSDYGVASLAGVIAGLLQLLLNRGLADVVVARPELDDNTVSTIFWANLFLATALFGLLQIAAGPIAACFGQPLMAPLLRWFGLCLFTTALTTIPLAVLRRDLRFEAFAARAAGGSALGGAVGIGMALTGWGVWSLVGVQLAQGCAAVVAVWLMGDWRPRMRFSLATLREVAPFSIHAATGATLDLLATRVDTIAVGLFSDPTSLGYYSIFKRILQTASAFAVYPVWAMSMPSLRRLAGDWPAFARAYASLMVAAQACWVPVIAGLGASAPDVLPAVFGAHWAPAAPLFKAALPLMFPCAIIYCTSQVLGAAGRADYYTPLAVVQLALTGLIVAALAPLGATAASFGFTVSCLVALPFHLRVLRRSAGAAMLGVLWPCTRIALAGGAMSAGVVGIKLVALHAFPTASAFRLTCLDLVAGVPLYLAALRLFAPQSFAEIFALARGMRRRSGRAASSVAPGAALDLIDEPAKP